MPLSDEDLKQRCPRCSIDSIIHSGRAICVCDLLRSVRDEAMRRAVEVVQKAEFEGGDLADDVAALEAEISKLEGGEG